MILWEILKEISILFLEMAPYLMLGLFFVGILHIFFTKDAVIKHIGKNNFGSILKSTLFGIPLPLCSCGVIPTSVYLSKNGASKPAVVSFLISTPQTGIDSMIATYGMMGWVFAIFRPFAALLMGLFGGLAVMITNNAKDKIEPKRTSFDLSSQILDVNKNQSEKISDRIKKMIKYSIIEFLDDISVQFIIGLIISGLIAYFIPDNFFAEYGISSGLIGMLIMVAIGAPMYVCATASIPIALTLMMKGFSPGAAFVFLAVGPATNAASFSILLKALGKKTAFIYLASIIFSSIVFGLILDFLFNSGIISHESHLHMIHNHSDNSFNIINFVLSVAFLLLLLASFYRKISCKIQIKGSKPMSNDIKAIKIEGMTCNHCVMNVQKAINSVNGVESVEINLIENTAYVKGDFDYIKLKDEVESIGYKVV